MQEYTCIFYETVDGRRPVEKFIESLDVETQDKFVIKQQLLQDFGPQLRHPHTDHLGEGIFELRFKGKEGQREENNIYQWFCEEGAESPAKRNRDCPRKKKRFFNEK